MNRGQKSGADAWVLVTLISLAMIGFIMFLPAADRDAILEGTEPSSPGTTTTQPDNLLLQKHVGRLEHYPTGPISHPISSVHLFHTTKSTQLAQYNPFTVERAVFSALFRSCGTGSGS